MRGKPPKCGVKGCKSVVYKWCCEWRVYLCWNHYRRTHNDFGGHDSGVELKDLGKLEAVRLRGNPLKPSPY